MTKVVKKEHIQLYFVGALLVFALSVAGCGNKQAGKIKNYTYKVAAEYPHDEKAYTQGLFIHDGIVYESTGQYGQSSLRKVNKETGEVVQTIAIANQYFAEGACVLNGKIYVLTWLERKVLVYDLATFEQVGELLYPGEAWGITTDGTHLIMSDGSSFLHFMNPHTFTEVRYVNVSYNNTPLTLLNELEYIDGEIWANVYTEDYIVRINPKTGTITGVVHLNRLLPDALRSATTDVLNGIAYDTATGKLYVTGKNWPRLYEIETALLPDNR